MSDYSEIVGKKFRTKDRKCATSVHEFKAAEVIQHNFGGAIGTTSAVRFDRGNDFYAVPLAQFVEEFELVPDKEKQEPLAVVGEQKGIL